MTKPMISTAAMPMHSQLPIDGVLDRGAGAVCREGAG